MWDLCEAVAESMKIGGATTEEIAMAIDSMIDDANWSYWLSRDAGSGRATGEQ